MPKNETPAAAPDVKLSIWEALPLITADIGAVGKGHKNKDQGYAFRGIDDVVNGIHGLFAKYGVGLIPKILKHDQSEVTSKSGTRGWHTVVHMQYKLTARDGSHEIGEGIGESLAYDDKGTPKAQAMSFKYFLTQAFTIPTQENLDTEYDKTEDLAPPPARKPQASKGERSAHETAPDADEEVEEPASAPAPRPAGESRSGPRPPRADQAGQGLAGSNIAGLRRLPPARDADDKPIEPTSDNDGAGFPPGEVVPIDQWKADELRKLATVGGKTLGQLTAKQLRIVVAQGDEYIAKGKDIGKGEIALAALEGAKLLVALEDADELP